MVLRCWYPLVAGWLRSHAPGQTSYLELRQVRLGLKFSSLSIYIALSYCTCGRIWYTAWHVVWTKSLQAVRFRTQHCLNTLIAFSAVWGSDIQTATTVTMLDIRSVPPGGAGRRHVLIQHQITRRRWFSQNWHFHSAWKLRRGNSKQPYRGSRSLTMPRSHAGLRA